MRLTGYITLCLLSLGVVGYAIFVYGFMPLGALVHPEMRVVFESERVAILAHIFASAVALAIGPLQFSTRFRLRFQNVHRWLGRLYLGVGVLIGGVAGFIVAFNAFGGVPARLGFACLALGWLYTGYRAYRAVRAGDLVAHRRWMVRNFALTFAAVMLRIYLPASLFLGLDATISYGVIAWLCWVPNLIFAELVFNKGQDLPRLGNS